ncbi:LysR family transcriptional regulator [Janthinobacterium sp.]|uniref:LysR family transcriptional regulator n=1 Tax=Janthinobacterium sp. TaxID=1871054 RepID=UPI00293D24A1|nr:LysR family transcriptional regulator [Janthinobacterium sp.]
MQNSPDRSPQWDDIRVFLALAREDSLSGAARALGVEHSTVARRVDALEQVLGLRLFDRLPRGWRLTPEGETLCAQAQRIEEEALAFGRAAAGASALRGTVRISAPPVLASHFLAPRLGPLRQRWPGIALELIGEARDANLTRREADLALRLTRPSAPGLLARAIGEMGFGLYATPDWLRRAPDEWEFLGYDESFRQTPQEQWLQGCAGARPFALRANDLATLHQGARAGLGVALLPHFLGAGDAALRRVPGVDCPTRRKLWLVMHPDLRRSPRVRAVADAVAEAVELHAALLSGAAG